MKATWTTRLYLGTALAALLAQCLLVSAASAETIPTGVTHTLPSSDKVDLTCDASGQCVGSIKFGENYVLNSITCLAAYGAYFYGYADISADGTNTRKLIAPNYVSPRYYWPQSSKYVTVDQNVDQPATLLSIHLALGNGLFSNGGWAQCYSTGSWSFASYHYLYDDGDYYHHRRRHHASGRAGR